MPNPNQHEDLPARADELTAGVAVGTCSDLSPQDAEWSTFPTARVFLAAQGALRIITEDAIHVLPMGQAAWIPAGLRHKRQAMSRVRLWTLELPAVSEDTELTVFAAPALMREMARTACAWSEAVPDGAPVGSFAETFAGLLPIWRQDVLSTDIPTASSAQLRRALAHLLAKLDRPVGLPDAARAGAMSERTLQRRCRTELDMSLSAWLTRARILHSLELLSDPDDDRSVSAIALACGYNSPAAFTRAFSLHNGTTPSAWRSANRAAAS